MVIIITIIIILSGERGPDTTSSSWATWSQGTAPIPRVATTDLKSPLSSRFSNSSPPSTDRKMSVPRSVYPGPLPQGSNPGALGTAHPRHPAPPGPCPAEEAAGSARGSPSTARRCLRRVSTSFFGSSAFCVDFLTSAWPLRENIPGAGAPGCSGGRRMRDKGWGDGTDPLALQGAVPARRLRLLLPLQLRSGRVNTELAPPRFPDCAAARARPCSACRPAPPSRASAGSHGAGNGAGACRLSAHHPDTPGRGPSQWAPGLHPPACRAAGRAPPAAVGARCILGVVGAAGRGVPGSLCRGESCTPYQHRGLWCVPWDPHDLPFFPLTPNYRQQGEGCSGLQVPCTPPQE